MRSFSLALFMAIATCLIGCERASRPNVLLIVIDTLRADRLGCYGNERGLTPFLDGLAKRGVTFTNAYAPSSWTSPSVASLFTSRFPSQHQVIDWEAKLGDDEVTLAEKLETVPYAGGGFSANVYIAPKAGFGQGFDVFRFIAGPKEEGPKARASLVQRHALAWLDGLKQTSPRLLFLQYMEPHSPYDPPEPFRTRFLRDGDDVSKAAEANGKLTRFEMGKLDAAEDRLLESLYDGEVAAIDAALSDLFGELERRGFLRNAIVIVTSDHGEEFREHGALGHGTSLYNELIRVPLLVAGSGVAKGRVVEQNVSLADIAPTLLEMLDLPPEPLFEGRSLVSLLSSRWRETVLSAPAADVISELQPKRRGGGPEYRRHESALMRSSLKLLVAPRGKTEIYDLASDPREQDPNRTALQEKTSEVEAALNRRIEQLAESKSAPESRQLDAATQEKLRQLGYGSPP